ncbi:DUF7344 domain-containing protein [Halosolutus halophilus]|uniref:DUF7344 domain-containing protein n=1 Tax=Halosolutus halophilus TaxID=1552990 RepID=UPI0022352CBD|nr:hypothetical protein [Halosolutus halophilus]
MIDDIFDALADRHRRRLLVGLLYDDPQYVAELSGVSREIADANEELLHRHLSSSRKIAGADEELLRIHHVHLPRLAAYGLIEWDRDGHVVTKGPRFDEVRPLLELLDGHRDDLPAEIAVEVRRGG